jgi:hypothetical protein
MSDCFDPRYSGLTPPPRLVSSITEEHSLLGASGAERWATCTPSARLAEKFPDNASSYAKEGRLAHSIGELRLRKQFFPMGPEAFRLTMDVLKGDSYYQSEMDGYVEVYYDLVNQIVHSFSSPPYVALEKKLDYSAWVPEGFGTGDCVIVCGRVLIVIDFKYGKGVPVSAEDNQQMMCYALGAYSAYAWLHDIQEVRTYICQPRLDSISSVTISIQELLAWGEKLKPLALLAWQGMGEYHPGDQCRFCRVAPVCNARTAHYLALEDWNKTVPPILTNADVGKILERAQGIASWVKKLEEYALKECLLGNEIPGWKAVEGRKVRAFTDYDAAVDTLVNAGYDEALFYTRKPSPLTDIEKTLGGRKNFDKLLSSFITIPPGKPALASVEDNRQPITRTDAAEDFAAAESEE